MGKPALADIALMADALREIATAIGCPANADPLTDLDGLVMMVQTLTAERDALRLRLECVEGEDVPILARSLALADESYLATKAALEAAGYPHVDGQPLADRVAMLAAERDRARGILAPGYRGTATAGEGGTATAGEGGTATAGEGGTATAGDYGTATAGHRGTATAGDYGTATAGDYGTATAGDYGTATAGHRGTATAGDYGTATAGDYGTATAGHRGTATAGDYGTATAGHRGTATAGEGGTATAGEGGTATAGEGGRLNISWYDTRWRTATAYVGEDGILPNVPYRLDTTGRFVRA